MTMLILVIVNVLLVLGMVLLPPVTGSGLGSVVTRVWLAFGILVFTGHYLRYLDEIDRVKARKIALASKARHRFVPPAERSVAHR